MSAHNRLNRRFGCQGMDGVDPYSVEAGRELDAWIHFRVLKNPLSHSYPAYSANLHDADALKKWLEAQLRIRINVEKTEIPDKPWFARCELERGNPAEVLAPTYPLAICRLAMVRAKNAALRR